MCVCVRWSVKNQHMLILNRLNYSESTQHLPSHSHKLSASLRVCFSLSLTFFSILDFSLLTIFHFNNSFQNLYFQIFVLFLSELVPVHLVAITGKIPNAAAGKIPHRITVIEVRSNLKINNTFKKLETRIRQKINNSCSKITNKENTYIHMYVYN